VFRTLVAHIDVVEKGVTFLAHPHRMCYTNSKFFSQKTADTYPEKGQRRGDERLLDERMRWDVTLT